MCVVIPFILDVRLVDVPAGVTQDFSTTSFCGAALIFIARRIQPFLSLVDREIEFCVLTNLIVLHLLGIFSWTTQNAVPIVYIEWFFCRSENHGAWVGGFIFFCDSVFLGLYRDLDRWAWKMEMKSSTRRTIFRKVGNAKPVTPLNLVRSILL